MPDTHTHDIQKIELGSLKQEIWDRALHAHATAFIFEQRARRLKRRLRWLTFVAQIVPVVVGGLALAYGAGFPLLGAAVAIGAAVGLLQLIVSTWSVVSGWVESYGYASTSLVDNQRLARDFKQLGEDTTSATESIRHRADILRAIDDARQAQDYGQDISNEEKRIGMRAALRERQAKCAGCQHVPTDMNSTKCGVCGDFKIRKI
ncbi:mobilome CxxCx(11)CxxC protein [Micromonospora sp. NPDC004704]